MLEELLDIDNVEERLIMGVLKMMYVHTAHPFQTFGLLESI